MRRMNWAVLLLVAVGLGALIRAELLPERAAPSPPPATPRTGTPAHAPENQAAAWAETASARPLFSRSRRPMMMAPAVKPSSAAAPRLTAIVATPAGRLALFARPEGGPALAIAEGDRLGEETVQSIIPGAITLFGPAGARVLETQFDRTHAPARAGEPLALPGMITNQLPPSVAPGGQPTRVP